MKYEYMDTIMFGSRVLTLFSLLHHIMKRIFFSLVYKFIELLRR